jgi:hypothetical protein
VKNEATTILTNTVIGPIYLSANWELVQKHLAPIIKARRESKADVAKTPFLWVAPSDPYWGMSSSLQVRINELLEKASTKDKKLYSPTIYLPVGGPDDHRTAQQWKREFEPNTSNVRRLIEGFLGGSVEVLHFEGEFVVVVYHVSLCDSYPVSFPVGFISAEKDIVLLIDEIIKKYINSAYGSDFKNDLGPLSQL